MKIKLSEQENLKEIGTIELEVVPIKDDCVLFEETVYLVMNILYSKNETSLIVRKHPRYNGDNFVV